MGFRLAGVHILLETTLRAAHLHCKQQRRPTWGGTKVGEWEVLGLGRAPARNI